MIYKGSYNDITVIKLCISDPLILNNSIIINLDKMYAIRDNILGRIFNKLSQTIHRTIDYICLAFIMY